MIMPQNGERVSNEYFLANYPWLLPYSVDVPPELFTKEEICWLCDAFGKYMFEIEVDATGFSTGFVFNAHARWDFYGNQVRFRDSNDAIVYRLSRNF